MSKFRSFEKLLRRSTVTALTSTVALALCATSSQAAALYCTSTIGDPWVDKEGNVSLMPAFRGDHLRVCNVKVSLTLNGATVDPITCVAWLSLIKQAATGNKQMIFFYQDIPSCATIPTYQNAPIPNFILLRP